jgi:hypothetical protein
MTEGRRVDLRERRAQRACRIGDAGGNFKVRAADTPSVAEFVNHSTLLCHQQQQQQCQAFD